MTRISHLLLRATAIALLGAIAASHALAIESQVRIDNFTFNPRELRVPVGTTVTWTNQDDIPHTVVDPPQFKSKALDTEETYSFAFTTPGTFSYFCSLHPHMTGVIVVESAAGENATQ
jgi:plastocyanin